MAIKSFNVGGLKTLVRAVASDLPNLVIITGSNGSGKSSLLTLLRHEGDKDVNTNVLHIGPHLPWRKGNLLKASVLSMPFNYNTMLAQPTIPHFSGQVPYSISQFQGVARDPDASDETQALVKVSIAGINEKYRDRLQSIHQTFGSIAKDEIKDPYQPIRDLIDRLLPHLVFDKIEEKDKNNIRVLFKSRFSPSSSSFDIDDLSSGEKATIALFLPVLEYQIEKILGIEHENSLRTFLIDEPELHLHPALQADVIAYFRSLSISDRIQFIAVTHSPTMIDAAQPEELFYLLPWQSASDGNQFTKLADTSERLVAIRELLGSAYAYSRGRPILFLEGEFPQDTAKQTDLGLLELILPSLRGYVFVPSSGKAQAIEGARRIRRAAIEQEHPVTAFALVDADYDVGNEHWVFPWPVCMVENLLLDADSLATILIPYAQRGALPGPSAVRRALNEIVVGHRTDEIRRRLKSRAGVTVIRHDVVVSNNEFSVKADLTDALKQVDAVSALIDSVKAQIIADVDREIGDGTSLLRFHGKSILQKFFSFHVQKYIQNYVNFVFQLAQQVAISGSAQQLVQGTIDKVNNYFPKGLSELLAHPDVTGLGEAGGIEILNLKKWAADRERLFENGAQPGEINLDRERELVRLLRILHDAGKFDVEKHLRPRIIDVLSR